MDPSLTTFILTKVIPLLARYSTQNEVLRKKLVEIGIEKHPDNSFDSIYLHSIIQFGKDKSKDLLELFSLPESRQAFYDELYLVKNNAFKRELDNQLHTNPSLRSLKGANFDYESLVEEFIEIFKGFTNKTKTPKDIETAESLRDIKDSLERITSGLNLEMHRQLDFTKKLIENFKPQSALELINSIEEAIEKSLQLIDDDKMQLYGRLYYQKGLALNGIGEWENSYKYHIRSVGFDPTNLTYKERGCTSHYFLDNLNEALTFANEILSEDKFNERANAIRVICDGGFHLIHPPSSVQSSPEFKTIYSSLLSRSGKNDELPQLFAEELENQPIPQHIDYHNLDYWTSVISCAFEEAMRIQPNTYTGMKPNYVGNKYLEYSLKLLLRIKETLDNKEIVEHSPNVKNIIFLFHYAQYLQNGNIEDVNCMYNLFVRNNHYNTSLKYAMFLALSQTNQYQKIIDLYASQSEDLEQIVLFVSMAFFHLQDINKSIESFKSYLKSVEVIVEEELQNLLFFIDVHINFSKDEVSFLNFIIDSKEFKNDNDRILLECYALRCKKDKKDFIIKQLEGFYSNFSELPNKTKEIIYVILSSIEENEKCYELLNSNLDQSKESVALEIYIETLTRLNREAGKLLEALRNWRVNFTPNERLLLTELKMHSHIDNWKEIKEVSEFGLSNFKDNIIFLYYLIIALHRIGTESDKLLPLLNKELLTKDFTWQDKFDLAKICIESDKVYLGLELFYHESVKHPDNPIIKENYFFLATIFTPDDKLKKFDKVELNTTVRFISDKGSVIVDVNENTMTSNPIVKAAFGKRIGDFIEVKRPLSDEKDSLQIDGIFDVFIGHAARISKEISENEITGMDIRAVTFPSDFEKMTKQLIEEFGKGGDEKKIQTEESFKLYYKSQISFSELVRRASYTKPLDIYSHLTSEYSKGFIVIPKKYFKQINLSKTDFVIDLSTIPILRLLSEEHSEILSCKFIVSQYVLEHLRYELLEAQMLPESPLSMDITSRGVRAISAPKGYKSNRIKTYETLINWLQQHCDVTVSTEKLNIIPADSELMRKQDWYTKYLIDTVFLSSGRVLVTDDRIFINKFAGKLVNVSSEYFLDSIFPDVFKDKLLPKLISNHYIGLKIYKENLENEYQRSPILSQNKTFRYCLENLPYRINQDKSTLMEGLDFIKSIYAENIPIKIKKSICQTVLVELIRDYPDKLELKSEIIPSLNQRFDLLQSYLPSVIDDVTNALRVLTK